MENDITNDQMCPCEGLPALLHLISELQLYEEKKLIESEGER